MMFSGKTAIVTGGAQGIGMATCLAFAKEGASVVIADVDREAGEELKNLISSRKGRCIFVKCDVAIEDEVKTMVDTAVSSFGSVDILINNAGIGATGTIYDRPKSEWDRVIAVNLTGPYLCTKYAAPHMKTRGGGSIVNIASTRALQSEPHTEPYSASKGGLVALTHSLAVSLSKDRIRVNAISPGWIETSEYKKFSDRRIPRLTTADHEQHPVGRVGRPEDIAKACLYLASEDASFITGTNLVIDGGMTVKMIYVE